MTVKWKAVAGVAVLIGLAAAERGIERTALAQRKTAPVVPGRSDVAEDAEAVDSGPGSPASTSMRATHVWIIQRPWFAERR